MGNLWRNFFYYTKNDRIGLIAIAVIIIATLLGSKALQKHNRKENAWQPDTTLQEYRAFKQALATKDSARFATRYNYGSRRQSAYDWHKPVAHPSPFNPNIDDSAKMANSGVSPFVARNIVRYRARGGRFRKKEDFAKIYGVDSAMFALLQPFIIIDEPEDTNAANKDYALQTKQYDKFQSDTVIDLNQASKELLKKIPGIGDGYSSMLISYRDRLGGFVDVSQINEIENFPSGFEKWFKIETSFIPRKININTASIDRLRNHPYMNYYKARAIVDYRKKHGKLRSLEQLKLLEEFDDGSLAKMKPYVEF